MAGKIKIEVDDLTIGDLETIEEIAGEPAGRVFSQDFSAKVLKALIFVVKRQENPDYTLEEASQVRFGDIDLVTDEDPPSGADSES